MKDEEVKAEKSGKMQKTSAGTKGGEGLARIVVYGFMSEKNAVGKHLSNSDLFLQHPLQSEFEQSVQYFNPHFLLRPGAKMPNIEALHISGEEAASQGPTVLDEVSKGRIWRIFDLASGSEQVPEVKPSLRLKSTLRE
jgi:hypothetical protein